MLKRLFEAVKTRTGSAVMALLSIGIGIYLGVYYQRQGELVIRIDALSRVFDIHRPVGGLDITFGGENLRSAKKTLWVLTATIQNRGNAAIRKTDFDEAVPVGFRVADAEVAEQPQLSSGVPYLAERVRPTWDRSKVTITPAIFEAGDGVQLSVLLLGPETNKPTVSSLGKVTGQRVIEVVQAEEVAKQGDDFASRMFPASTWPTVLLQWVIRLLGYLVIAIAGLMAFMLFIAVVIFLPSEKFDRWKRKRQVAILRKQNPELSPTAESLLNHYIANPGVFVEVRKSISRARRKDRFLSQLAPFESDEARESFIETFAPYEFRHLARRIEELGLRDEFRDAQATEKLEAELGNLMGGLGLSDAGLRDTDRPMETLQA